VAPFDAAQARMHQATWAKHLGLPAEMTNSLGMKFTLIPPGEFLMGSTPEEQASATENIKKASSNPMSWKWVALEGPQHRVRVSRAFYLGAHDVTQEQYERLMGANPSAFAGKPLAGAAFKPPLNEKEQHVRDELSKRIPPGTDTRRFAVDTVMWVEADEFCRRLTALPAEQALDARYRLPTEAQWEYACRAGTTTPWHNGSDPEQALRVGWFIKNSRPHEVGELASNAWGLYDLHGARPQWCADCYDRDYYARSPAVDPYCTSGSSSHMFRGGEGLTPYHGRSACRGFASVSGSRMLQASFRVLLEIALPAEKTTSGTPAPVGNPASAAISTPLPAAGAGPTTPSSPLPPAGEGPGVRGSAPPPAVAPFDAAQARTHQAAWARHLGVPVEVTNALGMRFALIPPGEFLMGSTPAEQTWAAEELRKAPIPTRSSSRWKARSIGCSSAGRSI
jgi:formylglycine-generating enzyme required for sulfatase activity